MAVAEPRRPSQPAGTGGGGAAVLIHPLPTRTWRVTKNAVRSASATQRVAAPVVEWFSWQPAKITLRVRLLRNGIFG